MSETITAIYEQGVLRPLIPLALPEQTKVQIQIIAPFSTVQDERGRVRQVLLKAKLIRPYSPVESIEPVSETRLIAAAEALGKAGPLSELIIAEREGR